MPLLTNISGAGKSPSWLGCRSDTGTGDCFQCAPHCLCFQTPSHILSLTPCPPPQNKPLTAVHLERGANFSATKSVGGTKGIIDAAFFEMPDPAGAKSGIMTGA